MQETKPPVDVPVVDSATRLTVRLVAVVAVMFPTVHSPVPPMPVQAGLYAPSASATPPALVKVIVRLQVLPIAPAVIDTRKSQPTGNQEHSPSCC